MIELIKALLDLHAKVEHPNGDVTRAECLEMVSAYEAIPASWPCDTVKTIHRNM